LRSAGERYGYAEDEATSHPDFEVAGYVAQRRSLGATPAATREVGYLRRFPPVKRRPHANYGPAATERRGASRLTGPSEHHRPRFGRLVAASDSGPIMAQTPESAGMEASGYSPANKAETA
jgi:hypothetical protein